MSPPTITTIPTELRQNILTETFNDAIEQDLILNKRLRHLPFDKEQFEVLEYSKHTTWACPLDNTAIATQIPALATTLIDVFPELKEDVLFVLDKSPTRLEKEQISATQKLFESVWKRSLAGGSLIRSWAIKNGMLGCLESKAIREAVERNPAEMIKTTTLRGWRRSCGYVSRG